ncbi:hypothetical protein EV424DRAFT_1352321 [Suillus variegatus]|nr:hypothetical protein EV424DRAFT_1352321 [Suillus variegatus]
MGHADHNPMDAQRFDPLRRTNMRLVSLFKTHTSDLGLGLCVRTEQTSVGDVRSDHEVVVGLVEGGGFDLEGSCPSPTDTCTTRATSSTPDDVYDPVDIVVTRTIIQPDPNPRRGPRMLSRPQMVSLVLQAFNCLSTSSAFDSDVDDMKAHRMRPVLLVIVKETREKYEDDRAFKEIVGTVFPAAGVRG